MKTFVETMTRTKTRTFLSGAALGTAAMLLAGAGGYLAHAQGPGGAVNPPGEAAAPGAPGTFADIVARVAPAVVSINVTEKAAAPTAGFQIPSPFGDGGAGANPFGFRFIVPQGPQAPQPVRASGSGFFISSDGYIVTNNHVVQDATKISVVTNGDRTLTAHVVGTDPATDLAVIKVDGGPFQYVSFEDRAKARVGDWVVAVGNPFGLGGTATAGIVSALGRQNVADSNYVDYMQIDAPINRGNSGGPTFDVEGRVVGVNTAIYTPSGGSVGIGFDIPADVAAQVTHQLIAGGQVVRGYIGATVQNLSPDLADSLGLHNIKGAVISQLTPGGPAEEAGLRPGDVVGSIDGQPVVSSSDLTRQIGLAKPGQDIRLGVLRNGARQDLTIRARRRPSEASLAEGAAPGQGEAQGEASGPATLGMLLAPDPNGGVVVEGLADNSDAAEKGLRQGDVILRAGARPVASPTDLAAAVRTAKAEGRPSIPLLVARAGQRFYVPVQVREAG
jgi:serine protease Do